MSARRIALAVLLCFAAATAQASAQDGSLVDLALTGSASDPAVNEGNAATSTCPSGPVSVDLGRPRPAHAARADPRRPRRELGPAAAVGRSARRLQRPAQRAGDGAPREGRRHAPAARPALTRLLGPS